MKFPLFVSVIIFLASFSAAKAQTPSVSGNSTFGINVRDSINSFHIPLKVDAGNLSAIKINTGNPAFVRIGSYSGDQFCQAITVGKIDTDMSLPITLQTKAFIIQGDYDVNIAYKSGTKTGFLNFTLHRDPAVLSSSTITITGHGCSAERDQLKLLETGNKGGAVNLRITNPYVPGLGSDTLIVFSPDTFSIKPSGQLMIPFRLKNNLFSKLPLGKIQTNVVISGDGLSAPLSVEVDIYNKRSLLWIFVMIFAGLGFGYLLRHYLQEKRDYEQARLSALELIRDITDYTKPIKDAAFQAKVTAICHNLNNAIKRDFGIFSRTNANEVNGAITIATTAFNALRTQFEQNLATSTDNFNKLKNGLFEITPEKAILQRLDKAQSTIDVAGNCLEVSDVTSANASITLATQDASNGLGDWLAYTKALILFLKSPSQFIPAASSPEITTELATLITPIDSALLGIVITPADPASNMGPADLIQRQIQELISSLEKNVISDLQNINPDAAADPKFLLAYAQWCEALTDIVTQPGNVLQVNWQPTFKSNLDVAWTNAAKVRAAKAIAVKALVPINPRNLIQMHGNLLFQKSPSASISIFSNQQIERLNRSYLIVLSEYRKATWIQTIILGILISIGLFAGYKDNFTGTISDLTNIFFFSFSLDVTVSGIAQLKGRATL